MVMNIVTNTTGPRAAVHLCRDSPEIKDGHYKTHFYDLQLVSGLQRCICYVITLKVATV